MIKKIVMSGEQQGKNGHSVERIGEQHIHGGEGKHGEGMIEVGDFSRQRRELKWDRYREKKNLIVKKMDQPPSTTREERKKGSMKRKEKKK